MHRHETISKWNRIVLDEVLACAICTLIPEFVELLAQAGKCPENYLQTVPEKDLTGHKPCVPQGTLRPFVLSMLLV